MGSLAALAGGLAAVRQPEVALGVVAGFGAAVVVVLATVDLRQRIIPNRIVLPATAITLLLRASLLPTHALHFLAASSVAGAAMLGLNLLTRSGVGMGDVKFALLIGATLGWAAAAAIVLAFLALFPVALATLVRGGMAARKTWLPFGPFLAFGMLVVLLGPGLAA
jgi:leader peptidase (prepilin peptidase)/N-methyltransferase